MSSSINEYRNVCNEIDSFLDNVDKEMDFHVAFFVTSFAMEQTIKLHILKHHEESSFKDCEKKGRRYTFVNICGNLDKCRGMKCDFTHIYLSIPDMKMMSSNQSAIVFQILFPVFQCENMKSVIYVEGKIVTPRELMEKIAKLI